MRKHTILCFLMSLLVATAVMAQEPQIIPPEDGGMRGGRGMHGGALIMPEGPPHMRGGGGMGMGMGGGPMHRGGGGMGRGGGPSPEMRELLEQILIARISQRLELSDEQTVLLVRRFSKFRDELGALGKERMELIKQLKKTLKAGKENPDIEVHLQALLDHERKMMAVRTTLIDDAGIELDAWQTATLYLFISEFETEMRQLVHRAFEQRRGEGGDGPRGPMGDMDGRPRRGGGRRGAPSPDMESTEVPAPEKE